MSTSETTPPRPPASATTKPEDVDPETKTDPDGTPTENPSG